VIIQAKPIGPYRLDFAVVRPGGRGLAIEADGYDFHSSKDAWEADRRRDRYLAKLGWQTIRFAGSEIHSDALKCAQEVREVLAVLGPTDDTLPMPVIESDAQEVHLTRVRNKIGPVILAFCASRLEDGRPEFHADDLRKYVEAHNGVAPASPDRVLRDLRQKGELGYQNTDRRKSLYRIDWVGNPPVDLACWAP
jgi:hypothetical protein